MVNRVYASKYLLKRKEQKLGHPTYPSIGCTKISIREKSHSHVDEGEMVYFAKVDRIPVDKLIRTRPWK